MRTTIVSPIAFAAFLVALGVASLVMGDFAAIWQPVPKGTPARAFLVYLSALVAFGSGLGLLFRQSAAVAARALLLTLLLWVLAFRVPAIVRAPVTQDPWSGIGETFVLAAAAWVLFAGVASEWDRRHLGFATGASGVRIARVLFGLALIPFGIAHFAYINETAGLVPTWLPQHLPIAYLTGAAFIAAGAAVLTGVRAQLAAVLVTVEMGLFTLLVWLPILAAGSRNQFHWSESVLSCALTISGWVVADSYRHTPGAQPDWAAT